VPVVITSHVLRSVRHRAEALNVYGCQEFLGRGFSLPDLVKTLHRLLPGAFLRPGADSAAGITQAGAAATIVESPRQEPPFTQPAATVARASAEPARDDAGLVELEETEITNWLDSLFPSSDSGDLAARIERQSTAPATRGTVEASPNEEPPVEAGQAREALQGGTVLTATEPRPVPVTESSLTGKSGAQLLEDAPVETVPEQAPAESGWRDVDTSAQPEDAWEGAKETLRPADPVPNLDPRDVPGIGPVERPEPTIGLAEERLGAHRAGEHSVLDGTASMVNGRTLLGWRPGSVALAVVALGGAAFAWWMWSSLAATSRLEAPLPAQTLEETASPALPARAAPAAAPRRVGATAPSASHQVARQGVKLIEAGDIESQPAGGRRPAAERATSIPGPDGATSQALEGPKSATPPPASQPAARVEPPGVVSAPATAPASLSRPSPIPIAPPITTQEGQAPAPLQPAGEEPANFQEAPSSSSGAAPGTRTETEPAAEPRADDALELPGLTPQAVPSLAAHTAGPAGEVPLDSVDTRPLAISKPAPAYPAVAQRMRLEGEVQLRVLVLESGAVGEVRIVRSPSPVLGEAAKKAAATWRYRPGIKDGTLVRVWITETIDFKSR